MGEIKLIMFESLYQNKELILKNALEFFKNSNSLTPKIGIELEFFLLQENLQAVDNQALVNNFISELKIELKKKFFLLIEDVEKEQGVSQVEIKTYFVADLSALAAEIERVKKFIVEFAASKKTIASFTAQPFDNDCGNAMQFNISLFDEKEKKFLPDYIDNMIAGLLAKTNAMMIFLAPDEKDYKRFSYQLNLDLFKKGKFSAPVNLSFGGDNRTCAIRVPFLTAKTGNGFRLEYRIACAEADVYLAMAAILIAIDFGIKNKLRPQDLGFDKIYGNAFDAQYNKKPLCQNLSEAKKFFEEENLLGKFLGV